jgi:hypothetical protein
MHDDGGFLMDSRPYGVPTLSEWRELWAMWDLATLEMLPYEMHHKHRLAPQVSILPRPHPNVSI